MCKLNFISIALLSMCIVFTACETEVETSSERIPIRISFTPQSRATDNAYENGDKVGLYVSNYSNSAPSTLKTTGNHVDNAMFTNNSSTWGSNEQLYWKDNTTSADFYAYYPYQAEISDVNECQFSVLENQSTIENLQASFFLWGKVEGQTPTESPISIETNHLMSSLRIYLEFDEAMTEEEKEIYNIRDIRISAKTNATINLADGTVTATGSKSKITPFDEVDCYRIILVPQENISISLYAYDTEYTLDSDITLQPNTHHKLTVSIQKDKLTAGVTFGIGEWNEDEENHSETIGIQNLKENIRFSSDLVKEQLIVQNSGLDNNGDGEISYQEAASYGTPKLEYFDNDSDVDFDEFQYFTSSKELEMTFLMCTPIYHITLPSSIETIGYYALGEAKCVRFTSTVPPTIADDANVENGLGAVYDIEVPKESVDLYKEALPFYADMIRGY